MRHLVSGSLSFRKIQFILSVLCVPTIPSRKEKPPILVKACEGETSRRKEMKHIDLPIEHNT